MSQTNIWFTSDEHYGHENIITKFHFRPFSSVEEMTESLIARHNERVARGDLVYHLGDMFWRDCEMMAALDIIRRLNGQHFYVRGNHEDLLDDPKCEFLRERFVWIRDLTYIHPNPKVYPRIVLCHYAMRTWLGSHRGSWQLYGHSHGALPDNGSLSMDVGVDANGYAPVSIEEVRSRMESRLSTEWT